MSPTNRRASCDAIARLQDVLVRAEQHIANSNRAFGERDDRIGSIVEQARAVERLGTVYREFYGTQNHKDFPAEIREAITDAHMGVANLIYALERPLGLVFARCDRVRQQ